ncbi:MAG: hypothetical protein J0I63_10245 [Thiobacillus sp.]|nr:hypothetical protein [Thiobacillus sp.]
MLITRSRQTADHVIGHCILRRAHQPGHIGKPIQIACVHQSGNDGNGFGKIGTVDLVEQIQTAADRLGHARHHVIGERILCRAVDTRQLRQTFQVAVIGHRGKMRQGTGHTGTIDAIEQVHAVARGSRQARHQVIGHRIPRCLDQPRHFFRIGWRVTVELSVHDALPLKQTTG